MREGIRDIILIASVDMTNILPAKLEKHHGK